MARKYHITCVVCDDCIWMGGRIVLKKLHFLHCLICWVFLICCDGAKCFQHGWINFPCIIKKGTCDSLYNFFILFTKGWRHICGFCTMGIRLMR